MAPEIARDVKPMRKRLSRATAAGGAHRATSATIRHATRRAARKRTSPDSGSPMPRKGRSGLSSGLQPTPSTTCQTGDETLAVIPIVQTMAVGMPRSLHPPRLEFGISAFPDPFRADCETRRPHRGASGNGVEPRRRCGKVVAAMAAIAAANVGLDAHDGCVTRRFVS